MAYDLTKFPPIAHSVSGLIGRAEAHYLNQVADRLGEGIYVDLGTFKGRSAVCIADGIRRNNLKNSIVLTIDTFDRRGLSNRFAKDAKRRETSEDTKEARVEEVQDTFSKKGLLQYIKIIRGNTCSIPEEVSSVNFVFIDAGHAYENCLADWLAWRDIVKDEVAFHDSHLEGVARVLSEGMEDWLKVDQVQSISVWNRKIDEVECGK